MFNALKLPIPSEVIEPKLTHCIGILWNDADKAGKTEDALKKFWYALRGLELFTITCNCTHASIAMSNNIMKAGELIKHELGFHPRDKWGNDL